MVRAFAVVLAAGMVAALGVLAVRVVQLQAQVAELEQKLVFEVQYLEGRIESLEGHVFEEVEYNFDYLWNLLEEKGLLEEAGG